VPDNKIGTEALQPCSALAMSEPLSRVSYGAEPIFFSPLIFHVPTRTRSGRNMLLHKEVREPKLPVTCTGQSGKLIKVMLVRLVLTARRTGRLHDSLQYACSPFELQRNSQLGGTIAVVLARKQTAIQGSDPYGGMLW
jgi:hypothetical protein